MTLRSVLVESASRVGEGGPLIGSVVTIFRGIEFGAAAYFVRAGAKLPDPPFVGVVVIRFGVAAPDEHYHVPLLLNPFGYSTYRGS